MISDAEEKRIKRILCKYIREMPREKTEQMRENLLKLLEKEND